MYYTTPEYRGEAVPCLYTLKPVKRDVDRRRGRSYSRQRWAYLRLLQQLFGVRVTPDCAVFRRIDGAITIRVVSLTALLYY